MKKSKLNIILFVFVLIYLVASYYPREQIGTFAALGSPATTTITTAGTYYPIAGTFVNRTALGFQAVADPALQYTNRKTRILEIDWNASLSANVSSTTVTVGVKINGTLDTLSTMTCYAKYLNELVSFGGTVVDTFDYEDKVQLVVTSDGSGDQITFDSFTTDINEFVEN